MVIHKASLPKMIAMGMGGEERKISLTPGKRVLFLTKNLELIKQQLYQRSRLRYERHKPRGFA